MELTDIRQAFVDRVHVLCDELGIPAGHGRQTALGKRFGVTAKAARKWLTGQGYPEMETAVRMCEEAHISVVWLLQGTPPMRGSQVDHSTAVVAEALMSLPAENRNQVLEYMRFQFESHRGWFTEEAVGRYVRDLNKVKARTALPTATEQPPAARGAPSGKRQARLS